MTVFFITDGLDELMHFEKNLQLVKDTKTIILGAKRCRRETKVQAVMKHRSLVKREGDILHLQIMGLSKTEIENPCENPLPNETLQAQYQKTFHPSPVSMALFSAPFYLTTSSSKPYLSLNSFCSITVTELQTLVFLHLAQQANKTDTPLIEFMQRNSHHILKVCEVAFKMLNERKEMAIQTELATILDENGIEPFGFIEKSNFNNQYQFVHLSLMKFCASIHLYMFETPQKVFDNYKLSSCLPTICGFLNDNERDFVSLISQSQKLAYKEKFWLREICEYNEKLFVECFFEAQASITEDLKRSLDERGWWEIAMRDGKSSYELAQEKYLFKKFSDAGKKLDCLLLCKNNLSDEEKYFFNKCSTNVDWVVFNVPPNDGLFPKNKIEKVWINIEETLVSKCEFEGFVPWIQIANRLDLHLHNGADYIDDICSWIRSSNVKCLWIKYCGEWFNNIDEFESYKF